MALQFTAICVNECINDFRFIYIIKKFIINFIKLTKKIGSAKFIEYIYIKKTK